MKHAEDLRLFIRTSSPAISAIVNTGASSVRNVLLSSASCFSEITAFCICLYICLLQLPDSLSVRRLLGTALLLNQDFAVDPPPCRSMAPNVLDLDSKPYASDNTSSHHCRGRPIWSRSSAWKSLEKTSLRRNPC